MNRLEHRVAKLEADLPDPAKKLCRSFLIANGVRTPKQEQQIAAAEAEGFDVMIIDLIGAKPNPDRLSYGKEPADAPA